MNKTDLFLQSIRDFSKNDVPENVKLRLNLALLDYIGVTLAGVRANGEKLMDLITEAEEGQTSVIGVDKTLAMENAVFCNGLNAHTLDFDDGTNSGVIHLGSPLFSVLLPLAERYDVSAERFIKAAILGYETSFTMAVSIQPHHKLLGYHATGTCGTLGIALAVAEMLGFDEKQRRDAFSAAAVSATGTLKVLEDGSDLKPYNVAKTALVGCMAAKMGKAGYSGPDDVLAGDRGFFKMMYGSDAVALQPTMLHGTYALEKAYIKPYAACRYCHPSIEAALTIRHKHGITAAEVERVEIKTYSLAMHKHDHTDIAGCGSAKMSIPYSVAVALCKGKAGMPEYEADCVMDVEIQGLTKRIHIAADDAMSASFPAKQTAVVAVITKDGRVHSQQVDFPKGEPENPMSIEEAREKFSALTLFSGRSILEADEIFDAVMDIENRFGALLHMIGGTRNHSLEEKGWA